MTGQLLPGLPRPTRFTLVGAAAEGRTELTAFDKALLLSGVGNTNLLKVSSILPPNSTLFEKIEIQPGSLLPIAYGYVISEEPGQRIAASVGVGVSEKNGYGVIMEFSDFCTKAEAEERVTAMVEEAFEIRGIPLKETHVKAVDHVVEKIGCVFAGVPLWY